MKSLHPLYVRFMVWLGAAPPDDDESLGSVRSKPSRQSQYLQNTGAGFLIIISVFTLAWLIYYSFLISADATVENTLYFPNIYQTVAFYGTDSLLLGPILLSISIPLWVTFIVYRRAVMAAQGQKLGYGTLSKTLSAYLRVKLSDAPTILLLLFAINTLGYGAIFSFSTLPGIPIDLLFRLDLSKITEIQVEPIESSDKCATLVISDKRLIKNGFARLETAQVQRLSHSVFLGRDGYSIKLTYSDFAPHYRYLMVYRRSTDQRQPQVEVVVPQLFGGNGNPNSGFHSPEFLHWIVKNVDPYFLGCQN